MRRRTCLTYAITITVSQIGWVLLLFVEAAPETMLLMFLPLMLVELAGPLIAERKGEGGTPWHPHHIAERYGLLAIIALGEVLLGTVASLEAVLDESGWTFDIALFVVGGVGLTFGMWWVYFLLPAGEVHLEARATDQEVGNVSARRRRDLDGGVLVDGHGEPRGSDFCTAGHSFCWYDRHPIGFRWRAPILLPYQGRIKRAHRSPCPDRHAGRTAGPTR